MHIHPFGFVSYAIAHSKHNKQFAILHNKAHVWLGLEFGWVELDKHSCNECSFRPFLLCRCFWRRYYPVALLAGGMGILWHYSHARMQRTFFVASSFAQGHGRLVTIEIHVYLGNWEAFVQRARTSRIVQGEIGEFWGNSQYFADIRQLHCETSFQPLGVGYAMGPKREVQMKSPHRGR